MGSKESKTTQQNDPPDWAKPLLTKGANDAMKLYDEKKGYNVYGGPTQAQFSPTTLQGMNSLMAATGGGAPITNESVFNNPAIQQARQQLTAQAQQQAAQQPQAAGQGVWMRQQIGTRAQGAGSHGGSMDVPIYNYINSVTGETTDQPPDGSKSTGAYGTFKGRSGGGLW
ncbi:hypothetical protein FJ973_29645 [Mesorhizobium sp. B2-1-3]|uniref:hypothetical protein n=1 Tax=Mesorhizobium sp. B2-1-3 TaxID=2589972 RepID=UPI001126E490|nr:hypothetical protein [Mesorhizobium sp. B2-1-3]TPN03809.1 hypothetical protein FJ973_29645 [Mesorhizobium sp. B2-1-3]